ncbi:hypothetical protein ABFS83_09G112100 [Erythranthe nasuta]
MGVEFEPCKAIGGGEWYNSDGELDQNLIDKLKHFCYRCIPATADERCISARFRWEKIATEEESVNLLLQAVVARLLQSQTVVSGSVSVFN